MYSLDNEYLIEKSNNKIVKVAENAKEFIVNNKSAKTIYKYLVDNGLIKQGNKCDFLIVIEEDDIAFLIELKGKDIEHALLQISSTLDVLGSKFKSLRVNGVIVCSRCKTIVANSPKQISLKKKLKNFNNEDLYVKTKVFQISV